MFCFDLCKIVIVGTLVASAGYAQASEQEAKDYVKGVVAELQRLANARQKNAFAKALADYCDLDYITKRILRSVTKDMNGLDTFKEKFTQHILNTYATDAKVSLFQGALLNKITVKPSVGTKKNAKNKGADLEFALVETEFLVNNQPTSVSWQIKKSSGSYKFTVVNIIVSGINLIIAEQALAKTLFAQAKGNMDAFFQLYGNSTTESK